MFKLLNVLLYKQLSDRQTQTGNVTYVLIGAKNINWKFAIWVQIFWKSWFPFCRNESGSLYMAFTNHNLFVCFQICVQERLSFEFYVVILTTNLLPNAKRQIKLKPTQPQTNPISFQQTNETRKSTKKMLDLLQFYYEKYLRCQSIYKCHIKNIINKTTSFLVIIFNLVFIHQKRHRFLTFVGVCISMARGGVVVSAPTDETSLCFAYNIIEPSGKTRLSIWTCLGMKRRPKNKKNTKTGKRKRRKRKKERKRNVRKKEREKKQQRANPPPLNPHGDGVIYFCFFSRQESLKIKTKGQKKKKKKKYK